MKTNFNIQMNLFPGFYESILLNSDTEYNECKEMAEFYNETYGTEFDENDFELDYKTYTKDCSELWAELYGSQYPSFVKSVKYESISSPKYYNYSTDKLYVDIEMDENWLDKMIEFINNNRDWFEKKISKDWSSRDGFISFMENMVDDWIEKLKEEDENHISVTLDYMVIFENGSDVANDVSYNIYEDIYISEYINLIDSKKDEFDETYAKWEMKQKILNEN